MAIEGSLADVSLADICQLLGMGRKTGCLSITDRSNFGYIYFEEGRVIYSSVLNRPDRLGELLVRNEVITREQLSQAMEAQAHESGKRLGQILVDQGTLSEEDLNKYISVQIEEAVYYLFTWEQGSFHFDPDQMPEEEGALLVSIPPESLLMEGARRVDEWSLIEKKIPSFDLIFALEKDPAEDEDLELTDEQKKVIPLIDGSRTVDEIITESGLVEFDVGKAVYGLIQGGFVNQTGRRATDVEELGDAEAQQHINLGVAFYNAGMLEDAEREFGAALQGDSTSDVARSKLALICLKGGRFDEAIEHYEQVANGTDSLAPKVNRALALEQLGRYDEALASLEEAHRIDHSHPRVLLNLAVLQLKAGKPDAARTTFQRYRTLIGDDTPPSLYYAFAVLAVAMSGDMDGAITIGREGLTSHPESGSVLVNVAVVLERQGEREAAEALYLRAVSEAKTPAQAHKNLGDMAYRRGDQAGARAHFERAVEIDAQLGDDVYIKLGNIAYKEHDKDWAQLLWRRALELNPHNEVARTNLEALAAAPG